MVKFYKTCREIPIHNFFELSRTGELKYLLKNHNEVESMEDSPELQQINIDIIDEYNNLFKDKRNEGVIKKSDLLSLQIKYQNIILLNDLFISSGITDEVLELAKKIDVELENIEIHIKTLKSQIKKLENQQEKQSEDTENDSDNMEKTLSLVKENGFNFDRYSTPVIEFVYAINRLEEKAKYYESLSKKK